MRRIKTYVYPYAQAHVQDAIEGFWNTTPFGTQGILDHCDPVMPDEAEYFYMGQVKDTETWLLHPNRWDYFKGNEARHIVDLEGDWRDFDHPEWLRESVITTGHARIESQPKFRRRFVRPVMSPLLMRLVRNPPEWTWPEIYGFWFQGQRDSRGLRVKVEQALKLANVPHEFRFNDQWGCYWPESDDRVKSYCDSMRKWAFALCPVGEGPTCRFYEACMFGRVPLLVGDYYVCGEGPMLAIDLFRLSTASSVEAIAEWLLQFYKGQYDPRTNSITIQSYGSNILLDYFKDPTAHLLEWLEKHSDA